MKQNFPNSKWLGPIFLGLVCIFVTSCQTTGYERDSKLSTGRTIKASKYVKSASPRFNGFKYLKNYTKTFVSRRESQSVETEVQFQGSKPSLVLQHSLIAIFSVNTRQSIKDKNEFLRYLESIDKAEMISKATYFENLESFGYFTESDGCIVARYLDRFKALGSSFRDIGQADTFITLNTCEGLTASIEEFIKELAFTKPGEYVASRYSGSVTSPASAASGQNIITRAFAAEWEGMPSPVSGFIKLGNSGSGTISLTLPDRLGNCKGEFVQKMPSGGIWNLTCDNNLRASGTYVAHGRGKGSSGVGTDSKGRDIKYTISGS
jgi:hypothetical protein